MASAVAPQGTPAIDAAEQAVRHVRRHLFPFRFERWLTLGLVCFLDQCPRRGGSFNLPISSGSDGEGGDVSGALAWLASHAVLASVIAAVVLAVALAFFALLLWVHSRAVFVYIDDVATGRAEIARPWRENAGLAGSYFAWSFGLLLVTLAGVLLAIGVAIVVVLGTQRQAREGPWLILTLVLGLLLFLLPFIIAVTLASLALHDFVAPLQWHSSLPCGQAIRVFLGLLRAHPWTFVLYVLLKIVFSMALAIVTIVIGCLTCCCAFLPVIHETALQPVYYFERAWSLHLLARLGFARFDTPPPAEPGPLLPQAAPVPLPV